MAATLWLRRTTIATAVALLVSGASAVASPQRFRTFIEPNATYDGRFTFVRLRYTEYGPSGWAFDYPAMERNLMTIVRRLQVRHQLPRIRAHPLSGALPHSG